MLETLPQDIGPKQFNEMLDDFQCRALDLSDHSLHHLTHFDSVAANLEPSGTFKTLPTYLFKIAIAIRILSCEFSLVFLQRHICGRQKTRTASTILGYFLSAASIHQHPFESALFR